MESSGGITAPGLLLWLAVATLGATRPLAAQDLQYDANQRIYILTYTDDAGSAQRVEIMPPNHIEPVLHLLMDNTGPGTYTYRYELANMPGALSTQSMQQVEIPCPGDGAVLTVGSPTDWVARYGFTERVRTTVCGFSAYRDAATIAPGQRLSGFTVISVYLPQIVEAAVWGKLSDVPALPGLGEVEPELAELHSRAVGASGGWYSLSVVGPGRAPDELQQPQNGIPLVATDLGRLCSMAWISQSGVCRSLRSKLDAASSSFRRGAISDTRDKLRSFLAELEGQHGLEPGKHVNDNAYWLLRTNVQYLLSRL